VFVSAFIELKCSIWHCIVLYWTYYDPITTLMIKIFLAELSLISKITLIVRRTHYLKNRSNRPTPSLPFPTVSSPMFYLVLAPLPFRDYACSPTPNQHIFVSGYSSIAL
jgi:hypothetical protein